MSANCSDGSFHSQLSSSHPSLRFTHSYHGHSLELTFSKDHKTLTGTYKPKVKQELAALLGAPSLDEPVKMRHPPGLLAEARLVGTLKPVPLQDAGSSSGGSVKVTGRWIHVSNDLQGPFVMNLSLAKSEGWWSDDDSAERVPWEWNFEERVTRLFRFIHSPDMTRFSLVSAYVFLILTSTSLFYSLHPTRLSLTVNCVFDFVYVSAYAFFMFVYSKMTTRPSIAYMTGVLLYLAGYIAFAVLTLATM